MREQGSADITPPERAVEEGPSDASRPHRPTVDEMGAWSFPASDPPATWTWDPVQSVDHRVTGPPSEERRRRLRRLTAV